MDILSKIVEAKRTRLEASKQEIPAAQLLERATARSRTSTGHRFVTALNQSGLNIIAEFKRRSPSKGYIRNDVDPGAFARCYQAGGARAVSVLTEQDHFAGSLQDLVVISEAVSLPVLRKDFIFDEYQIYETAAAGAHALLLIVATLNDAQLANLRRMAEEQFGLDALVEVHDEYEMRRAISAGSRLIGVNNRNLRTFEVSLETSVKLASAAPDGTTLVSESGLNNSAELRHLQSLGYKAFLIGESLMRAKDPTSHLKDLISLED